MSKEILLRPGKLIKSIDLSSNIPLGVEYEELVRNLKNNSIKDLRNNHTVDHSRNNDKTFLLQPGLFISYDNDQSDSEPYPDSNVPNSSGETWSDYY